ncbi:MAG TPA: hypothetical protein VJO13_21945 [Ktedonobacterales bacterium]|nr:hypothetical protein [Ktedonobacterales bacterium]
MYSWIVFVHVLGVFGFLLAHGAAAIVAFRLRGECEVERVRALLDLSRGTRTVASVSLLVTLAAGITAAFMGNWWSQFWIWASLGLLALLGVVMNFLGTRSLNRVRQMVQPGESSSAKEVLLASADNPASQRLADTLTATHPMLLAITGGGGLALILWLMMFKPF